MFKLNNVSYIYLFVYLSLDWLVVQTVCFLKGWFKVGLCQWVGESDYTNLHSPSEDTPTFTTNMARHSCCSSCARLRCWSYTCMNLLPTEWANSVLQKGKVNTRTGQGKDWTVKLGQRQKSTTIFWQHVSADVSRQGNPGSCREQFLYSSTARSEWVSTSGYGNTLMMSWWPPTKGSGYPATY